MQSFNDIDNGVEALIRDNIKAVKYVESCYDSIFNPLKKKNDDVFHNKVLPSLDDDLKKKLLVIRNKVDEILSQKKIISLTLITNYFVFKNEDEVSEFYDNRVAGYKKFFRRVSSEYAFYNCHRISILVAEILRQNNVENYIVKGEPDHVFNIFKLNDKIFIYDAWYGHLLGEFTPEFFYENCSIFGVSNLKIIDLKNLSDDVFSNSLNRVKSFTKRNVVVKDRVIQYLSDRIDGRLYGDGYSFSNEDIFFKDSETIYKNFSISGDFEKEFLSFDSGKKKSLKIKLESAMPLSGKNFLLLVE